MAGSGSGSFHLCPLCRTRRARDGCLSWTQKIFHCQQLPVSPEKPEAGSRLALGSLDCSNMGMFWFFCRKEARWGCRGSLQGRGETGMWWGREWAQQAGHYQGLAGGRLVNYRQTK